ncbi:hypothetical protein CRUP_009597, partial [Coryphaenoides rupestris]
MPGYQPPVFLRWVYQAEMECGPIIKEITLTEGSRVFETWKSPPPPVYMQYFFFNVTNLDEVMTGGKPVLDQIGPYTY